MRTNFNWTEIGWLYCFGDSEILLSDVLKMGKFDSRNGFVSPCGVPIQPNWVENFHDSRLVREIQEINLQTLKFTDFTQDWI